jgi:hypothetical protein
MIHENHSYAIGDLHGVQGGRKFESCRPDQYLRVSIFLGPRLVRFSGARSLPRHDATSCMLIAIWRPLPPGPGSELSR